jgi:hypothetical protein
MKSGLWRLVAGVLIFTAIALGLWLAFHGAGV